MHTVVILTECLAATQQHHKLHNTITTTNSRSACFPIRVQRAGKELLSSRGWCQFLLFFLLFAPVFLWVLQSHFKPHSCLKPLLISLVNDFYQNDCHIFGSYHAKIVIGSGWCAVNGSRLCINVVVILRCVFVPRRKREPILIVQMQGLWGFNVLT